MITLGIIVGNRGFFPDHLCRSGRATILKVLKELGIKTVAVAEKATKMGAVESLEEARICGELFRRERDKIDGVLVTLPNFGDERAVANALRFAGLDVPVLVHAFGDDQKTMTIQHRRDSFCGKISVCSNLRQYGIKYSLTSLHTVAAEHPSFKADLLQFAALCRVTRALRGLRVGMIGARPAAFNTVRYSEKLLETNGISVETLDLSELLGWANRMKDGDAKVRAKRKSIKGYTKTKGIPEASLLKMSKLGVAIDGWMKTNALAATAIQCWTALEEFYGVVPCTLMSMMSNAMLPSACETDVAGVVAMVALKAATGRPAALLDWNNNYGEDENKGVVFHCSNLPKDVFVEHEMNYQEIIAGTLGKENTYGTIYGRIQPGTFTYMRVSTDDLNGKITSYCGEGRFTKDPLATFGGYGVVEVPAFQKLLHFICERGFEHHVSASLGAVGPAIAEAAGKYLGWECYQHVG